METITKREARLIDRHYKQKLHRGKNTFARWVDYAAFRLLILAGAYLWLLSATNDPGLAVSLAVIAVSVICVALELYGSFRLDMFVAAEKRRMAERYVLEELTFMPPEKLAAIAAPATGARNTAVRQSVKPLDEDDILSVYRELAAGGADSGALVTTAKLTPEAEAFAARLPGLTLTVMGAQELLKLAEAAGVFPDDGAINALILDDYRRQKEKRRLTARAPFARARTRRYIILGAALIAASFLADYAIYYRLLGGLCMSFAAISRVVDRG